MNAVKLKNGSTEHPITVATTRAWLDQLDPTTAFELVAKCRDSEYKVRDDCGQYLVKIKLATSRDEGRDITINGTVKNVVLSSVQTEARDISFGSPLA